jgi:hypothetical protein
MRTMTLSPPGSSAAASVQDTVRAIHDACQSRGGVYPHYRCHSVSRDDASRTTHSNGSYLASMGTNVSDMYLHSRDGRRLFTLRPCHWNEKLGWVRASDVAVVVGTHAPPPPPWERTTPTTLEPVTLRDVLLRMEEYDAYINVPTRSSCRQWHWTNRFPFAFRRPFCRHRSTAMDIG